MKFRSGYEERVYNNAIRHKRKLAYEPPDSSIVYIKPARKSRYKPDFVLGNGVIVETKGRFTATDRAKMLNVIRDNPNLDIRLLFQRANQRITSSKNSMTYGEWATKHGFIWSCGEEIPEEWFL